MPTKIFLSALLGTCLAGSAFAAEVGVIRSVTLSSGGVAEIERSARVNGSESIEIEVPIDQVDDVLKSLIVRDSQGGVTSMSLAGSGPAEETFRTLPFTADDLQDPGRLVGTLQGTRVRISSNGKTVEGLAMGLSTSKAGEGKEIRALAVLGDDGRINSIELGTDAAVEILDESMRKKVAEAMRAVGKAKVEGARTISILVDGKSEREVGISYVVPASVWKTAYRIVNKPDQNKAMVQAWAVIENSTGENWNNVDVVLSSGAPVTLKQRLHERYWRNRPEVPVSSERLLPPVVDGAEASAEHMAARVAPAPMATVASGAAPHRAFKAADQVARANNTPTAEEGSVNATYRLPHPIDLAAGETFSSPIIDTDLEAERIAVFRPGAMQKHPISAIRLKNTTDASLPPGIVTVYDEREGYVGDAMLPILPKGVERYASFAADRNIEIASTEEPTHAITAIKAADGMLHASVLRRSIVTYRVKAAEGEPRKVMIEHPKRAGWSFTSEHVTSDDRNFHRLVATVPGGDTVEIKAVHEFADAEVIRTSDADSQLFIRWSNDASDQWLSAKLKAIAEARAAQAAAERAASDAEKDISRIESDQARIRENLRSVPPQSELATSYLRQMTSGEESLAKIRTSRDSRIAEVRKLREKVAELIRSL